MRKNNHILECNINSELIILNLENGKFFGLQDVSLDIWNLLSDDEQSPDVIVKKLAQKYDDVNLAKVKNDVEEIISGMIEGELIIC